MYLIVKFIWALVLSTTFISDRNIVEENAPGVGDWGGECQCPDGATYKVGDNIDNCATLACVNGEMLNCNRKQGVWSGRKVTCKGILLLSVLSWLSLYHIIYYIIMFCVYVILWL